MFKRLLSIIFVLALLINNVAALEADVFVQSTVNRASKLLSDNITKEEKIEKLKLIAKDTVDIEGIGFYTLGSVRKDLSDDQKKEYAVKFEEYFFKKFFKQIS
jgi:phospholipid transport system substrate-binding protein